MKTVFLHGLGQNAHDWDAVINCAALPEVDCPELLALTKEEGTYSAIIMGLENDMRTRRSLFSSVVFPWERFWHWTMQYDTRKRWIR